ncbi:MAG: lysophospholipid acyltransferase family protein, partial [Pseudomonadota bacterium]
MLQRFVNSLIRIITSTFFRRIDVVGLENVPADGPVIFAGNHPNALMDGWLLTATCGRWPLHFMVNAKLWKYKVLGKMLDASGAVPVYPREEHGEDADNSAAFERLFEVVESGDCMGVFPEGVSHVETQLISLKTGTARIALTVAERGNVTVTIVPCGLNYIHRHRFRSQVLIEFGEPIVIDDEWLRRYKDDAPGTVRALTDYLADAIRMVTINAPDWSTLRFAQTTRRLYKPSGVVLSPKDYIKLNKRFIEGYLAAADDPALAAFRRDADNYQTRLDVLGIKDHQLRKEISIPKAARRLTMRALAVLLMLPLAIPGALLHLPFGWIAAAVGNRFSYEQDDVATLKVISTIAILPLVFIAIGLLVGRAFGPWWALVAIVGFT